MQQQWIYQGMWMGESNYSTPKYIYNAWSKFLFLSLKKLQLSEMPGWIVVSWFSFIFVSVITIMHGCQVFEFTIEIKYIDQLDCFYTINLNISLSSSYSCSFSLPPSSFSLSFSTVPPLSLSLNHSCCIKPIITQEVWGKGKEKRGGRKRKRESENLFPTMRCSKKCNNVFF